MNLNAEQLDMVEEMAGLFFSPEDISICLEFNELESEEFADGVALKATGIPIIAAYHRGWLSGEVLLRKAIKQAALNGSSPSQQQLLNFQKENRK